MPWSAAVETGGESSKIDCFFHIGRAPALSVPPFSSALPEDSTRGPCIISFGLKQLATISSGHLIFRKFLFVDLHCAVFVTEALRQQNSSRAAVHLFSCARDVPARDAIASEATASEPIGSETPTFNIDPVPLHGLPLVQIMCDWTTGVSIVLLGTLQADEISRSLMSEHCPGALNKVGASRVSHTLTTLFPTTPS